MSGGGAVLMSGDGIVILSVLRYLIVAPLEPPELSEASKVPAECQATRMAIGHALAFWVMSLFQISTLRAFLRKLELKSFSREAMILDATLSAVPIPSKRYSLTQRATTSHRPSFGEEGC